MPKPNRDRQPVSLYLARAGVEHVDQLAQAHHTTRSEVLRLAVKYGLVQAERDLAQRAG